MYSIIIGTNYFKWNMLSLSGTNAILFLQLLIAFITRSAVNALSNGLQWFPLGFPRHYIRVSLEEMCLYRFEVLNCWLNLVASCLDDENELPFKVIASFSTSCFALSPIRLIFLHSLVRSVFWSMVSTKTPFFPFMHADAVLDGFIHFGSSVLRM